jgi:hypothetical protein
MARWHPSECRLCGRKASDGFYISARGLCQDHSLAREAANIVAMREKRGELYTHWLRRSFMAYRRALVASEQGEA